MQGYDIYQFTASIPGRNADPQPIIFAYISLNLHSLSQNGSIQAPVDSSEGTAAYGASSSGAGADATDGSRGDGGGAAANHAAVQQMVAAALSEQQKAELKGRLKDVMSRLMQRDQSGAAMQELYVLRRCALPALPGLVILGCMMEGGRS